MRSKSYKDTDKDSKTKTKSKTKGNNNKGRFGKDARDDARLDNRGRDNDPNYYFFNAELAQQAAQLSFQNMVGSGSIRSYKMPSIMRIDMNPSPGVSYRERNFIGSRTMDAVGYASTVDDSKHGINLMSSKLYTMLSTFTGRTSQYAPQDVAMMILAISSIAEFSEAIRRMFGIALTYNPRNRNLPLGLLRSMGIDVGDFIANLAPYRMRFNVAMTRINQIPLLDNIGFIRKSRELYQRIYMDSPSPMAQIFYYMPFQLWLLDETSDPNGTVLQNVYGSGGPNNPATVGNLLGQLETMITALLESSTLNLIYADLLNMASKIKVPTWQFDYLAENYIVVPEYNANALLQLHHMRSLGQPFNVQDSQSSYDYKTQQWQVDPNDTSIVTADAYTITRRNMVVSDPNKNNIIYNPAFADWSLDMAIVDMPTPDPTIEDRIEALRFTAVSSGCKVNRKQVDNTNGLAMTLVDLPDHYVVNMHVFDNIDYSAATVPYFSVGTSVLIWSSSYGFSSYSDYVAGFEKFKNHPYLYFMDYNSKSDIAQLCGDTEFYTTVDHEYIQRLNELMYTGLFDFRV